MKSAIFAFIFAGILAIGAFAASANNQNTVSKKSAACSCGEKCSECCGTDCSSCTMGCCSK